MASKRLTVVVERSGADGVVVVVGGEADVSSAEVLRAAILSAASDHPVAPVVVDLSGVEFIDSTGLSALVSAQRSVEQEGSTLALRSPSRNAQRILEVTGLDQAFDILDG